jgi:polyisoprenyl-teichoic acid--peptidoglycan teichoic acid transferase
MIRRPKIDLSVVLLLVVVGILVAISVFVYLSLRTDTVSSMVDNGETIRVLLVTEEDGSPISTQVLIYNPRTNRVGLFDAPHDLGAILESLNRVDSIATLYEEGDIGAYRAEIENLLGVSIPFYLVLDTEGVSDVVDLAEGLELFIAESYQMAEASGEARVAVEGAEDGGASAASGESGAAAGAVPVPSASFSSPAVLLPAGNVTLDGEKVRMYLTSTPPGEPRTDRIMRRLQFTRRFLEMLGDNASSLRHEQVAPYVTASFEKNLDDRSLFSLIGQFSLVDTEQMIQRRIQGNFRSVDSHGETKRLLFPHFEGEWLRQSVRQVEQSLASGEELAEESITVSLEILNGTSVSGLARRTKELYEGYGFDVVSFDNADSSDVEHTRVLDRTGNIALARRAAGIIHATRIESEPLPGESAIDVTVILGQDFDGTYVRE